jgi:hypothetical protein
MVKRKWLLRLTILVCFLLLAVGLCLWLVSPSDRITERNCNRVEPGMSAAQVEDLLGRKPDAVITVGGIELQRTWLGRTGSIDVAFDDHGQVVSHMPFLRLREESFLERLRSWLPW